MTDTGFWDRRRNRIRTRAGGWTIGQGISVRGYSLLDDLVGRRSFFELLCLEVLGQLPEERLARWIEGGFLCLSFPDPRIWCNQIGALAGSTRVPPTVGIAAGVMASYSSLYGPGTTFAACEFLARARTALDEGESLDGFLGRHLRRDGRVRAPGFSRPIAQGDDRVGALARLSRELGFEDGMHVSLAWRIDEWLRGRAPDEINMLGYVVAFLLDRGIGPAAIERLYAMCVNAGVHACYTEAATEPPGGFLPLSCADVEYTGTPARELPARESG